MPELIQPGGEAEHYRDAVSRLKESMMSLIPDWRERLPTGQNRPRISCRSGIKYRHFIDSYKDGSSSFNVMVNGKDNDDSEVGSITITKEAPDLDATGTLKMGDEPSYLSEAGMLKD